MSCSTSRNIVDAVKVCLSLAVAAGSRRLSSLERHQGLAPDLLHLTFWQCCKWVEVLWQLLQKASIRRSTRRCASVSIFWLADDWISKWNVTGGFFCYKKWISPQNELFFFPWPILHPPCEFGENHPGVFCGILRTSLSKKKKKVKAIKHNRKQGIRILPFIAADSILWSKPFRSLFHSWVAQRMCNDILISGIANSPKPADMKKAHIQKSGTRETNKLMFFSAHVIM